MHREPLGAISSLATAFTGSGNCSTPSDHEFDAVGWRFASLYVRLPFADKTQHFKAPLTCRLSRAERVRLALAYWVRLRIHLLVTHPP